LNSHRPCGSKYYAYSVATKVFGEELVNQACDQILSAYLKLGYGKDRAKIRLLSCICDLLLTNRSPYIEDLTIHLLNSLRNDKNLPAYIRRDLLPISCALTSLGIISKPLSAKIKEGERFGNPDATNHVSPQWLKWFQRWHDTSNLAAKTKISTYYNLLKFGRWLLQKHPEVVSPEQFNRQLAIELVADINKMKIGEYVESNKRCPQDTENQLSPRSKNLLLFALRTFFRDCQEWDWIPRNFSPDRALATPRSVRALIGPNPRVIADSTWAKLLWAGLNLSQDDLPCSQYSRRYLFILDCV